MKRLEKAGTKEFISWLLVLAIAAFYIPAPSLSAGMTPIGQMITSAGKIPSQFEATVFDGDTIQTAPDQMAAITLKNGSLINLASSSTLQLKQMNREYRLGLNAGKLSFSKSKLGQDGMKIQASNVEVILSASDAARGRIVVTDKYVLVSALENSLQVASSGKSFSIREGDSATIPSAAASDTDPSIQSSGGGKKKNSQNEKRGFFGLGLAATFAIIGGAGTGAAVAAWEATKSDPSPSRP